MSISYIITSDGSLTAFLCGKSYTISTSHMNYEEALAALRAGDEKRLEELLDITKAVTTHSGGGFEVRNGVVYHNGEPQHNEIAKRVLQLIQLELPFKPILEFMGRVQQNPSFNSRKQLYDFLEHQLLPITEDGHFLAYKRVSDDWKDLQTRSIDNSIGAVVSMPRAQVDDNPLNACSAGLHAGSIAYVKEFCSGGHVIVVKVDPADVVSVPSHDTNKMRVCRYKVLCEYVGDLTAPVYETSSGQPTVAESPWSTDNGDYDDGYEDGNGDDDNSNV